jgi:nitroreductase
MPTLLEERHDILQAIYERRAVRAYTAQRPDDGIIQTLLDAAVQAPTAMHSEPWVFVVIQDQALLKRLSDRAKAILLKEMRSGCELTTDPAVKKRLERMLGDPSFNIFYDAGTLIVICRKHLGPYAEADCWLAAENLMLAACARHLGTCCIGFAIAVLNGPDVKRELKVPDDITAVAPIIVGFPRGTIERVSRQPPQVLSWIR